MIDIKPLGQGAAAVTTFGVPGADRAGVLHRLEADLAHGWPIEPEDMRRAIETQVCPWCHRGPFKILLAHLAKYGLDRFQVRDMAELPMSAKGLADPDTSGAIRVARRAKPRPAGLRNGSPKGERRNFSLGGRLEQGRKHTKNPERFSAMAIAAREAEKNRRIAAAIRFLEGQGYTVTSTLVTYTQVTK